MSRPGHEFWRKSIQWLPGLLISLGAVLLLLPYLKWSSFLDAFSRIQVLPFSVGVLLFLFSLVLRAFAWRFFLKNEVRVLDTVLAENEGYLLNNVLPFRLGEIGRAMIMGKVSSKGTSYVLSSIALERMCDVIMAAFFIVLTLPSAMNGNSLPTVTWIFMGLLAAGIIVLSVLAAKRRALLGWLDSHHSKSRFVENQVKGAISNFIHGLEVFQFPRFFLPGFACMVGAWGMALLEYYVLLRMFLSDAPIGWAALGLGALAFGVAVPSAPANVGVFEVALVAALALVGVANDVSVAYALMVHVTHFALNGVLGLIGLRIHGSSLSRLWSEVTGRPSLEIPKENP